MTIKNKTWPLKKSLLSTHCIFSSVFEQEEFFLFISQPMVHFVSTLSRKRAMTFEVGLHKSTSQFATFNQQQKLSIGTNYFGEEKRNGRRRRNCYFLPNLIRRCLNCLANCSRSSDEGASMPTSSSPAEPPDIDPPSDLPCINSPLHCPPPLPGSCGDVLSLGWLKWWCCIRWP